MRARRAAAALMALLLAGISACGTNERRAREWALANRDRAAAMCADMFPAKVSETLRGKPVLLPGRAALIAVDTLRLAAPCPDGTQAECPPATARTLLRTDTIARTDTLKIRDTAMETAMAAQRDAAERKLQEARQARDEWRGRFLYAAAALAALLLWGLAARK